MKYFMYYILDDELYFRTGNKHGKGQLWGDINQAKRFTFFEIVLIYIYYRLKFYSRFDIRFVTTEAGQMLDEYFNS